MYINKISNLSWGSFQNVIDLTQNDSMLWFWFILINHAALIKQHWSLLDPSLNMQSSLICILLYVLGWSFSPVFKSSIQTARTVESLFHSSSFTWEKHTNAQLFMHHDLYFRSLKITYIEGLRSTLTCSFPKGRVKSPCNSPFFSINTTLCLLGCRCVEAIRLPEGLEKKNICVSSHQICPTQQKKRKVKN